MSDGQPSLLSPLNPIRFANSDTIGLYIRNVPSERALRSLFKCSTESNL